MTTLKDTLYDVIVHDILQEMYDIVPSSENLVDINDLLDEALEEGEKEEEYDKN